MNTFYYVFIFVYIYINNYFLINYMDFLLKILEIIIAIVTIGGFLFTTFRWVCKINRTLEEILSEVKPNSGKSLKDRVTAIQEQVNKDSNSINTICCRQKWLLDNRPEAIFECDTTGSCTWVNEKYCQLLQHDVDFFLGNGWKNGIHSEDLDKVQIEWERAIKDKRSSVSEHRVVDREGNIYKVKVTAIRNEHYGYIGHIEILEEIKK